MHTEPSVLKGEGPIWNSLQQSADVNTWANIAPCLNDAPVALVVANTINSERKLVTRREWQAS